METSTKYIRVALKMTEFFRSSPYYWDGTRVRVHESRKKILAWYLNIACTILYELFVIARCLQIRHDPLAKTTTKIYMEYVCFSSLVPIAVHINILLFRDEWTACINRMMNFGQDTKLEGQTVAFRPGKNKRLKLGCEKFQKWVMLLGNLVVSLRLLNSVRHPERPECLSSVMRNPAKLKLGQLLPFFLVQAYHLWSMYSNLYLLAVPVYFLIFAGLNTIGNIKRNSSAARTSVAQRHQQQQRFEALYRISQLLAKDFNFVYGFILPAHKILFILMIIRSTYAAIRLSGSSAIMMFLVALLCSTWLLCTFSVLADYHELSAVVLSSWSAAATGKELQRFLRSCPQIRIQVGSYYYVDKPLVLTLISIVVSNTITLLLT